MLPGICLANSFHSWCTSPACAYLSSAGQLSDLLQHSLQLVLNQGACTAIKTANTWQLSSKACEMITSCPLRWGLSGGCCLLKKVH